jgi:hypothetical protein
MTKLKEHGLHYINKKGFLRCDSISAVASMVAWITNTKTTKEDWEEFCINIRKITGADSLDYVYHDEQDKEHDCTVTVWWVDKEKKYAVEVST